VRLGQLGPQFLHLALQHENGVVLLLELGLEAPDLLSRRLGGRLTLGEVTLHAPQLALDVLDPLCGSAGGMRACRSRRSSASSALAAWTSERSSAYPCRA
jgi:hypothetical protein